MLKVCPLKIQRKSADYGKILAVVLLMLVSIFQPIPAQAATDGILDTSFDTDGIQTTSIGSSVDVANSVVMQADGKIVVAGKTYGSNNDIAVVRYNTNGSLDTSFDTDGIQTTPIGSSNDAANSVVMQADGKIVVAGETRSVSDYDFAIVRYNTNGSLDTSFDTDGIQTTPIGSSDDVAYSVVMQADGKIVVTGETYNGSDLDFAIVRYNSNGSLDTSFDTDGIQTTPIGIGSRDVARSVVMQANGKIVAAGKTRVSNEDIAVVRYNTNGSLDTSFDTDGIQTTPIGSSDDLALSVVMQADGKIVVTGYTTIATNDRDFAIVRYNTNGSLDTNFDTDGIQTTPIGSSDDLAYSVVMQADGKIVVTGYTTIATNNRDFAIVRYNTNGSLDTNFDTDGIQTTSISSASDYATSVVMQADGKVVVAGFTNNNSDFAIVRYENAISTTPVVATPVVDSPVPAVDTPTVDLVAQAAAAADLAARTITSKKNYSAKSLAKKVGLTIVSTKATVSMSVAKASKKVCTKSGSKLKTLKAGKCVVTFTVQEPKSKRGKLPKATKTTKTLIVK
jgi:uncharacterized delta-60 repeat protein